MEKTTQKNMEKQNISVMVPVETDKHNEKYAIQTVSKSRNMSVSYRFIKRGMDIVVSMLCLLIFSPIFLIIPIIIKAAEPKGPVFFGHVRNGQNGKKFKMYKFRSMCLNAEEVLMNNNQLYAKFVENGYKLNEGEDPRITKIGKILRKTSIDELPQLLNVFVGSMSLVGPRPIPDAELKEYGDKQAAFLSVKPGITGWWQVSGRSNIGYPERCKLELEYVSNRSLKLDIMILFKTFFSVLNGEGAR